MTTAPIRIVVLLGALTLVSLVSVQVYWSSRAINSLEQQFSHHVRMSLHNVVESVCEINGTDIPLRNPVEQISNSYFIVRTNQPIHLPSLERVLITEFENREIKESFEYGVYDCQKEQMIYGKLITMDEKTSFSSSGTLPKLEDYDYYFGVYFPQHRMNPLLGISWLKFTTGISLLVFLFFAYTLFLLLRQKKLSAIQKDFINNITHEFKTPVASIKMATEVLNQEKTAGNQERVRQYARLLKNECLRLESNVTQLLRSTEAEHQHKVKLGPVSLEAIISKIKQETSGLLGAKKLETSIPNDLFILGDDYMVETVLYNLIENAVKYGGNSLFLSANENRKHIIIDFYDNGAGLPKTLASKVFNKFYRVSEGNRHSVKGFGLGLYVAKVMTKNMKGSIHLFDPTTAHFRLTFQKA